MEQMQPLDKKQARLELELSKSFAAEDFFSKQSGQLVVTLLSDEITRLTRDITSDKFEKDHTGYLKALADLQANRNLLRRLQVYGSKEFRGKVETQLEVLKDGTE